MQKLKNKTKNYQNRVGYSISPRQIRSSLCNGKVLIFTVYEDDGVMYTYHVKKNYEKKELQFEKISNNRNNELVREIFSFSERIGYKQLWEYMDIAISWSI